MGDDENSKEYLFNAINVFQSINNQRLLKECQEKYKSLKGLNENSSKSENNMNEIKFSNVQSVNELPPTLNLQNIMIRKKNI